jgi:hypothetical protein
MSVNFVEANIIQALEWAKITAAVKEQTPPGRWIFRALETPDDKDIIFHAEKPTVFQEIKVEVSSSFDKAWDSRSWNTKPERWRYEAWMLREFKRAAYLHCSQLPEPNDYLEWLALARHYGMPSRLLDFSYTFYVASYFAYSGKRNDKHGFILAINLDELKEKTEAELSSWGFSPPQEDWDFHNRVIFREFAFKERPLWVAPVAPGRKNERLLNQQGLFLCPGSIEQTFEENLSATLDKRVDSKLICLHQGLRTDGIQDLRRMNVDMRGLYPDLTGFAQSMRDLVHMDIDPIDGRFEKELERSISESPWY